MKKKLLAALTLTLCLLMLCTACGKDKQPSSDAITPPDNTQDITPDNTQNVTPPDSTTDDNKTPDDPTPPAQDDPTPPVQDDPTPPAQDDPTPPAQDDPTPPVQDDPTPPVQDNNKDPVDDLPKIDPVINLGYKIKTMQPSEQEKQANRELLNLYRRFFNSTWYAIYVQTGEKYECYDLPEQSYYIDYAALVDFGSDGVPEMVIVPTNRDRPCVVVFYEQNDLYIDFIDCREMQLLTYDGVCKNSLGGIDRLTFSAQNGCERQSVISVVADAEGKTQYYAHADLTDGKYLPADPGEITEAEYEEFMPEQTFPVFYADKSKYSMISVPSEYSLPTDDVIEANHDVLQAYYDFINGACVALNRSAGEYVTFDAVTRYGTNKARNFGLVDFGSDGVLEMVLNDTGYHYYTVLYYMDGQLYEDGYSYRTFSWPTYTGIAVGSGGSSGSKFMVTYTEQGRQEWTFMYYGLDREIYEDRYYISAAYEDGKLVPAETVEVDKYTYYSFLENEPSVQGHTFDDETLKKVLKVDSVTAASGHSDGGDTGFDAAEQNAQAIQAYYQWLTGGREAVDTSHPNVRRTRTDMAEFSVRYGRFGFADFGSDGVVELVLEYATTPSNHTVLYYDDGELYIGSLYCDNLKENGYYEEEANWGGVRLLHHYIQQYAPSRGVYSLELGYETPPSKDSPNPVYRLYYTLEDGEYVLNTGESSKDALYSVLKERFDTPDITWYTMDKLMEHEFFAGVTGNN